MQIRMSLQTTAALFLWTIAGASTMAQDSTRNPTADETAVRAVSSGFSAAWNSHDMVAFAALFAEDADFVNVIGLWWRGKPEIQKGHEAVHATIMKHSHLTANETSVRFLRPDVAVVRVRWELTGQTKPDGSPAPARTGILTHVIAKTGARWLIAASQNTDIEPVPPRTALPAEIESHSSTR